LSIQVLLVPIVVLLILLMVRLDGAGMSLKFVFMPLWIVNG
jgi:hypothetical protein